MGTLSEFLQCVICKNPEGYGWWETGTANKGGHCYSCGYRWSSYMDPAEWPDGEWEGFEELITLQEINHHNFRQFDLGPPGMKPFFSEKHLTPDEYEKIIRKRNLTHLLSPHHLRDASGPTCWDFGMWMKKKCGYCNWFKNLNKVYHINWITRNPLKVKE